MPGKHEWRITGMDCPACTAKIQNVLSRKTGLENIEISLVSETLRLIIDEKHASKSDVEAAVKALGYGIESVGPDQPSPTTVVTSLSGPTSRGWYQTAKGRLVLITGILLVLAWGTTWFLPENLQSWPFVAACLAGLLPIAYRAFNALRLGQPFTIEALMTLAASGALFIGAAQEAALVVFLFAVGELLEGVAVSHARDGIKALGTLVPKTALKEEASATREVPASDLVPGDIVQVRPGDRIPADGDILSGTGGIDESPVTGESVPITRGPGDAVFAGSINTEAALRVRVTKAASDNTIARIIRLVEDAEAARAPTERFIDRFSQWYMPAIVILSALVICLPPLAFGQIWSIWIYRGLSLLLIGCPCALVISVPAAIASALSLGARNGLLLKGGAVIETAAKVSIVALDKTGTLTKGQPDVTDLIVLNGESKEKVLGLAAAIEATSSHPLALAILRKAEGLSRPVVQSSKALAGKGVTAEIDGRSYTLASPRHAAQAGALSENVLSDATTLEAAGKTVAVLYAEQALALIGLRDEPRNDASEAMRQLRNLAITPVILTGDNARTAAAIAADLGTDFKAELLPEQKLREIQTLNQRGKVMMVGDGINDAPALKQAAVGVAIGSGTDVALETADAAILRNRVTDIPGLIRLSRITMRNVRENVVLALGLKGVFLVTSIVGVTGLWIAIMADTGATVLVTLNALRLLRANVFRDAS
ncbi:MAG: heavy metal translocating P-type ATPase [Acetobacter sp.]|jgi:Cd2+/Zn2+-exporting ATPase|uniref:heavy metal translocating P-type ATPase n=1 Tax=Acetobacter orientalis TaxID=146474 RepID=UPI00209FA5FE|nr:heavy metal translocating P-type ATPase [Acetobacter orientalis]MCP1216149.1 heavy metal translocating P-type ATPase [Acetobacter orientalis]MCP1219038.1 heavy metal translocating P-type ATPase [Acetobacter orientalis]